MDTTVPYVHKRFLDYTNDNRVLLAIEKIDGVLLRNDISKMLLEIFNKNDFRFDSGHGYFVAKNLYAFRNPIAVEIFTSFNPFTRSLGYYANGKIRINSRKLKNMSVNNLVGFLLHEYSHYCGYTHGNNYESEEKNLYSVPYYLSSNVERWL